MVYGVCGKVAQECYTLKSLRKRKGIFLLIDVKKTGGKISRKSAGYQGRNSIDLDMIENDLRPYGVFLKLKRSGQMERSYPEVMP